MWGAPLVEYPVAQANLETRGFLGSHQVAVSHNGGQQAAALLYSVPSGWQRRPSPRTTLLHLFNIRWLAGQPPVEPRQGPRWWRVIIVGCKGKRFPATKGLGSPQALAYALLAVGGHPQSAGCCWEPQPKCSTLNPRFHDPGLGWMPRGVVQLNGPLGSGGLAHGS